MEINTKTTLTNRLLLLWLLYDALKYNAVGDTKAHKLAYLAQLDMMHNQEKGFSYDFIKDKYGPISGTLQHDVDWLENHQLITSEPYRDGKVFNSSYQGNKILQDFHAMFVRNNTFTVKIGRVNSKYALHNTYDLVEIVHKQYNPECPDITIHETPRWRSILHALPFESAKYVFEITPEEEETLEIYMDIDSYNSAIEGCESAKTRPLLKWDDVC